MALRNYIYYKHEDDLKDKIAHGSTNPFVEPTPEINGGRTISYPSSGVILKKKAKKLTPTQIRKLENIHITEKDYVPGKTPGSGHVDDKSLQDADKSRSHSTTSINSMSSSDLKED